MPEQEEQEESVCLLKINSVSKFVLPNMAVFPINTFKISWGHTIHEIEKKKQKTKNSSFAFNSI